MSVEFAYVAQLKGRNKLRVGRSLQEITPGAKSKVKSSVQRAIRAKILETYTLLTDHIDEIIPKKGQLDLVKL